MERPDALLYSITFYGYLAAFLLYIAHVALKKEWAGKVATLLIAVSLVPHTAAFFTRWAHQGHIPLANMYEYMGLMSWMVSAGLLYFIFRYKNHKIGVFVSPVPVMMLVVASLLPSEINRQLMPALQSTWLAIHVTLAALGSGAFLIAFAASALYLLTGDVQGKPQLVAQGKRKVWGEFLIFWVGVPVVVSIILTVSGLLPIPTNQLSPSELQRLGGSSVTSFSIRSGDSVLFFGRQMIGLGIALVLSAIAWPIVHGKRKGASVDGLGARFFLIVVLGLLLAAVVVGFLIQANIITVTGRSYFKIFEFFGPTLVISWLFVPLLDALLGRIRSDWIGQLGLQRKAFEEISYSAVAIGYPLYTVGALFAGAIWAEQAWGNWWSWDPKEVGALIIWLFYTGFLHARYQRQWRGNRATVLVVLGMVFVFISFFGNYFFGGLHSFEVT